MLSGRVRFRAVITF
ncbi:Putative protein of unknown function [Podospora comata]|nr:Putative protein of unknown function [Podospora comata]